MRLDDLDNVVRLAARREKALEIRTAAQTGTVTLNMAWGGRHYSPTEIIAPDTIRATVVSEIDKVVAEVDQSLLALGVHV